MILRSMKIEGWRCFSDPVEVGPFKDKLNVVHSLNALGKSTLFDALIRGLFDPHRVSGRDVEDLRPWGRALAPTVTIEFSHGGQDYRLTKRFLDRPSSELHRKENGQFRRLAEGDSADDLAREILLGKAPGRGLSRPRHWGLAQVLWVPQGGLPVKELAGGLIASIQTSLGAQLAGPGTGTIEERIEAAYGRIFTRKTGKIRTGKGAPKVVDLRQRLHEARKRRQEAFLKLGEFEEASRKVEDLGAQWLQARRDEETLDDAVGRAAERAQSYANLVSEQARLEEKVKSTSAQYRELKQRINSINKKREDLAKADSDLKVLGAQKPIQARQVETLKRKEKEAKEHRDKVRGRQDEVEKARRVAELAQRYVESTGKLVDGDELLKRVTELEDTLKRQKDERTELIAPDSETLQIIRDEIRTRDTARARLEAALITMEITAERDLTLDVVKADETGQKKISAGTDVEVKGAPEVVVHLKGVASIRTRGPSGSIEELRDEVAQTEQRIEKLTFEFGTENVQDLEALHDKARKLDENAGKTETKLDALLSGKSIQYLKQDQAKTRASLQEILKSHPEWEDNPPDAAALKIESDKTERDFISEVRQAEDDLYEVKEDLSAARENQISLESGLVTLQEKVELLRNDIEELEGDGLDDRQRKEQLDQYSLEWHAAKAALKQVEDDLGKYGDDPGKEVQKLEIQLDELRKHARKTRDDQKSEEGRLRTLCAEAPYSALARAEEQLALLEEEITSEELHVNAIKLLRETIIGCRKEILASVALPVEKLATTTLHRIAGPKFRGIRLGEAFQPENVIPALADRQVPVNVLSGGEKEQIHLAVRLALAEVLAEKERQLVVLDDVLAATDTPRLARILSILEEAAERLQILILTCHPERYAGLADAACFDLEKLQSLTSA